MWSQSLIKGLNYTLESVLLEKVPLGTSDCHLKYIVQADLAVFNSLFAFVSRTGHQTQGLVHAREGLYH